MSYRTSWSAVDDIDIGMVTLVIAAVGVVRLVVVGSWNPDVVLMREVFDRFDIVLNKISPNPRGERDHNFIICAPISLLCAA